MVSCLGDKDGKEEGNGFLLSDSDLIVKGRWEKPGHSPLFGMIIGTNLDTRP
ncbi:selenium-binding protein 1 [Artemisia annua]|uniref:Selenium-binding protein 1 n=1 Tax=Artemisia annua TaxID=35608 RepID=A0A2U1KUS7_ARTAN|nr:selenium-binding protein 1 [Artemisia annua]